MIDRAKRSEIRTLWTHFGKNSPFFKKAIISEKVIDRVKLSEIWTLQGILKHIDHFGKQSKFRHFTENLPFFKNAIISETVIDRAKRSEIWTL